MILWYDHCVVSNVQWKSLVEQKFWIPLLSLPSFKELLMLIHRFSVAFYNICTYRDKNYFPMYSRPNGNLQNVMETIALRLCLHFPTLPTLKDLKQEERFGWRGPYAKSILNTEVHQMSWLGSTVVLSYSMLHHVFHVLGVQCFKSAATVLVEQKKYLTTATSPTDYGLQDFAIFNRNESYLTSVASSSSPSSRLSTVTTPCEQKWKS